MKALLFKMSLATGFHRQFQHLQDILNTAHVQFRNRVKDVPVRFHVAQTLFLLCF